MPPFADFLIAIGLFFLLGLGADVLGRRTAIPRVTFVVVLGIALGPAGLDWIPRVLTAQFEWLTNIALVMVGFLLGGSLTAGTFQRLGAPLFWVSLCEVLVTALCVSVALWLFGLAWQLALLLGCIAAATAAEVAFDTVAGLKDKSEFSTLLLGVVALDDVWGLLLFSVGLAILAAVDQSSAAGGGLIFAARELFGGALLGVALGVPAAMLTGRIKPGEPMMLEALGLVFLCSGLSLLFEVSFLLSAIVMGATIANLARHHSYPFHAIENIEWPFLLMFFVLAGTQLQLDALAQVTWVALAFVISRVVGKWLGAYLGAAVAELPSVTRRWIGLGLLPQAGAAIGMALIATYHFPQYQQTLLQVVIATTVVFEVFGPVLTALAIRKASSNKQ